MSFEINTNLLPVSQNLNQPNSMHTTTDAEINSPMDTASAQQQAFMRKALSAVMRELTVDAARKPGNAKSTLDRIGVLIHDYSADVNSDLGIPLAVRGALPPVNLANMQPIDDVNAIKENLGSRESALEKQLNQLKTAVQDDKLRTNANYNAVLPKIRSQQEEDTDIDGAPWSTIEDSIKNIKENYLDFYSKLMQEYTEMYRKYNELVQQASGNALSQGSDGNNVKFNSKKMNDAFKEFDTYLQNIPRVKIPGWDEMSPEQQRAITDDLKPAFKVVFDGFVEFDTTDYETLKNNELTAPNNEQEIPIYKYQAWLSYFNTVGSGFQSNMNSFAQRYKQANDTANNLYKLLSGSISTWGEIMKGMIQAWR